MINYNLILNYLFSIFIVNYKHMLSFKFFLYACDYKEYIIGHSQKLISFRVFKDTQKWITPHN